MDDEYDALKLIAASFSDDSRLGFVPVLDRLDDGIVMGEVVGEPLSDVLARSLSPVWRRRTVDLVEVLSNAGLWLRRFQTLPAAGAMGARLENRDEVVDAMHTLTHYLRRHGEGPQLLAAIADLGTAAAKSVLPKILPVGLAHGDFAPRNILIDREGKVVVIDTRARWRAPVWEDVATMLVSLRASRLRAMQATALENLERAFLERRFEGEPIPRGQIRVFELLILLDRWAARRPTRSTPPWRRARMLLVRRQYARLAASLLPALEHDTDAARRTV